MLLPLLAVLSGISYTVIGVVFRFGQSRGILPALYAGMWLGLFVDLGISGTGRPLDRRLIGLAILAGAGLVSVTIFSEKVSGLWFLMLTLLRQEALWLPASPMLCRTSAAGSFTLAVLTVLLLNIT